MVDFKHVFHRGNAGRALIRRVATVLIKWVLGSFVKSRRAVEGKTPTVISSPITCSVISWIVQRLRLAGN